jgi:Fic family protein
MIIGNTVNQPGGFRAFIPHAFPPNEEIVLDAQGAELLERANLQLGRLDGITELLPDLDFFILMYVRKESALSSQLEGTQATLADAIRAEGAMRVGVPHDVDDIERYVAAMNHGLERLSDLPLSLRLIREVHGILLGTGARATSHAYPGEFRTSQNWIGGASPSTARYVPPPPTELLRTLGDLENFLHDPAPMAKLVKAGLAHAQFETIHPFVDGNGRSGRLMTTFFLCEQRMLSKPVLYLSEFFKKNRDTYFDLLHAYHEKGDVRSWLNFFLEGIAQVSEEAIITSREITAVRERDVARVSSLGRGSATGHTLLRHLFGSPIVSVRNVETITGLARPNANKLVNRFVELGILVQSNTSPEYGRTFVYEDYLDLFQS